MFEQIWTFLLDLFAYLSVIVKTLPRDLRGLGKLIRHSLLIKYHVLCKRDFIAIFRKNVKYYRSKPCFILEETSISFQQVGEQWKEFDKSVRTLLLGGRFDQSARELLSRRRLCPWGCHRSSLGQLHRVSLRVDRPE